MKNNVKSISGNWDVGYALDKHSSHSVFTHHDEYGHPRYDTTRTEIGESVYQLKYKKDWSQVGPLAEQIRTVLLPKLTRVGLIIPMPASIPRDRQPVHEVARALGRSTEIPVFENLLVKNGGGAALKNLTTKAEKDAALDGRFGISPEITNDGHWNALLIDDLFHTGASMEAACTALRSYAKIYRVYVAALTWR